MLRCRRCRRLHGWAGATAWRSVQQQRRFCEWQRLLGICSWWRAKEARQMRRLRAPHLPPPGRAVLHLQPGAWQTLQPLQGSRWQRKAAAARWTLARHLRSCRPCVAWPPARLRLPSWHAHLPTVVPARQPASQQAARAPAASGGRQAGSSLISSDFLFQAISCLLGAAGGSVSMFIKQLPDHLQAEQLR